MWAKPLRRIRCALMYGFALQPELNPAILRGYYLHVYGLPSCLGFLTRCRSSAVQLHCTALELDACCVDVWRASTGRETTWLNDQSIVYAGAVMIAGWTVSCPWEARLGEGHPTIPGILCQVCLQSEVRFRQS